MIDLLTQPLAARVHKHGARVRDWVGFGVGVGVGWVVVVLDALVVCIHPAPLAAVCYISAVLPGYQCGACQALGTLNTKHRVR